MKSYKNFVNGKMVDVRRRARRGDHQPGRTSARSAACRSGGEKDVDRAVDAAAAAFEKWQDTTPGERSLMLLKLADRIEQNAEELAVLEADNVGKPIGLARSRGPVHGRQPALLRRRVPLPRGQGRGRVPRRLHEHDPPRAGGSRRARSRPGTTR